MRWSLAIVAAGTFASCNRDSGVSISDQSVLNYVKSQMLPYLSVTNVTAEKTLSDSQAQIVQYNFKVTATPAEPLYIQASFDTAKAELLSKGLKEMTTGQGFLAQTVYDFKGLDQREYLKQVNAASDSVTIYGSIAARKIVDRTEFGGFNVASGLDNLGKPRGSFPPDALVIGSPAYKAALDSVLDAQNKELARQQEVEREKKAGHERRKADLLKATAPGARYEGTWSGQATSRIFDLEFVDQKMDGKILQVKMTLPDDPKQVVEYQGYIEFSDEVLQNDHKYPIRLKFVRGNAKQNDWGTGWSNLFYQNSECDLDLVEGRLINDSQNGTLIKIDLARKN